MVSVCVCVLPARRLNHTCPLQCQDLFWH